MEQLTTLIAYSLSVYGIAWILTKSRLFSFIRDYTSQTAIAARDSHFKAKEDSKGNPLKLVRINQDVRLKRVQDAILALKTLSGGAKLTTNLADVTPKLIVLATFKSGNHPFSHLAKEKLGKAVFSIEAFEQVFKDYQEQLEGNIYIGKRTGFMDELNPNLEQLSAENGKIFYGSINEAIDKYAENINLD